MNTDDTFGLALQSSQVEWILAQLDPPSQRLYPNPFGNLSPEQIGRALTKGRLALGDQGLLKEDASGGLVLDVTVAGIVGALGFADRMLHLSLFRASETEPVIWRYFHAEGLLVEQQSDGAETIGLTALRDIGVLRERICAHLGLGNQSAPTSGRYRCAAADYADVPYILAGDGESEAAARLVELGADTRFARDLICAMASPLGQATLQVVALDAQREEGVRLLDKIVVVEGIYGLWAIVSHSREGTEEVEIVPCDANETRDLISNVVHQLVP